MKNPLNALNEVRGHNPVIKSDYGDHLYDILRLDGGEWVWCGYGKGKATLPKEVRKRLDQGRPSEFETEGQR
jgi:hypothetical protein